MRHDASTWFAIACSPPELYVAELSLKLLGRVSVAFARLGLVSPLVDSDAINLSTPNCGHGHIFTQPSRPRRWFILSRVVPDQKKFDYRTLASLYIGLSLLFSYGTLSLRILLLQWLLNEPKSWERGSLSILRISLLFSPLRIGSTISSRIPRVM